MNPKNWSRKLGLGASLLSLSFVWVQTRAHAQEEPALDGGVSVSPPLAPEPGPAPEPLPAVQPAPPPPPPAPPPPPPVEAKPAAAPRWSPVFTGSYFTRYEVRSGYDDLSLSSTTSRPRLLEGDAFYYRVRFGIGTGLIDLGSRIKVGLQFTPQTTGTFGNLSATPNAPTTVMDANLSLHEGYARVQGLYARVDAGRFEMNYGDSVVIGNLDWNELGRTFDGFRSRFSTSSTSAWLDVFATVLDDGRPDVVRGQTLDSSPGISLGDLYFLGAYAGLGPLVGHGLDLDAYALSRVWGDAKEVRLNAQSPVFRREHASDITLGIRAKQRISAFDYRFEGGIQAGRRPGAAPTATTQNPPSTVDSVRARAFHGDLELGANMAADKLRIGAEVIYASGDDAKTKGKNEGWDELYPTAHRTLGLSDAWVQGGQKRTNTLAGLLHLTVSPLKILTLHTDGMMLARPEHSVQYKNQSGLAAAEVDMGGTVTIAKGLKVRTTYALFLPRDKFYTDVLPQPATSHGADPVHFCEVELRYTLD